MLRILPAVPSKLALAIAILSTPLVLNAQEQNAQEKATNESEKTEPAKQAVKKPEPVRLEEIIVTSQKIAENLQDVPISVATVTGEKLADAGVENLEDLTAYLPNIHFTETGISTQVRVRGIGSDNSQGFEQSVGMYIDGIYYGRAQLFRSPMMDLERAELLRGPQSTLFGKNSIAGALNLTTAQPTEEFEAKLSSSYEFEHEQTEVNGMVSGPITDTLRARVAVRTYEDLGYMDNTYESKLATEPYADETAARIIFDWTPSDTLQFNLKAERNEFKTIGRPIELTRDVTFEPVQTPNSPTYAYILQNVFNVQGVESNPDFVRQTDGEESSDNEINNITLTTNIDLQDYALTLVTGSVSYDYQEWCDCDFVPAEILELELNEEYDQFSQEIRLSSPMGEEFEWTAGLFYQSYEQKFTDDLYISETNLLVNAVSDSLANTAVGRDFSQESDSWAVFGRVTWNVTDQFNVTVGARYTQEKKDASKEVALFNPTTLEEITNPFIGYLYLETFLLESQAASQAYLYPDGHEFAGQFIDASELILLSDGSVIWQDDEAGTSQTITPQALVNSGHSGVGSRDESAFTPLINFEYNVNDDLMTYATFTTGFKAGGFDPRSNSIGNFAQASDTPISEANPTKNFEFEEEKAIATEFGFKSTLADGQGELNGALYFTKYKDLQISQFDGGVGFNVGNAKETEVLGAEIDGRWALADGLTLKYGLSYLEFEYKDFEDGNCNVVQLAAGEGENTGATTLCSYTGKRGVYTPEYTINLSLDYVKPLNDTLTFVGFVDLQQVAEQNVHVNLDPNGEIDAYTMLTARVGIDGDNWSVGLLGKNLLDEYVASYSANAPLSDSTFATNTHYTFVRRPMSIALEGTLKF